jgi:hypothetical protein
VDTDIDRHAPQHGLTVCKLTAMICSNALTSPNDSLLQATSRRLEDLGLHTLRATSTGDTEAVSALFAQFINCTYRSYALEERWLTPGLSSIGKLMSGNTRT